MEISQNQSPNLFNCPHYSHFMTADGKGLIHLTGIILVHWEQKTDFKRERVNLGIIIPSQVFPDNGYKNLPNGKMLAWHFNLEHWSPFFTLNAISTISTGSTSAVDGYERVGDFSLSYWANNEISFGIDIAAQRSALLRVGYSVMLTGTFISVITDQPT